MIDKNKNKSNNFKSYFRSQDTARYRDNIIPEWKNGENFLENFWFYTFYRLSILKQNTINGSKWFYDNLQNEIYAIIFPLI